MTFSNDPRQVAQSLAGLWPSLVDDPPSPQDYALAMERQAGGLASPSPAPEPNAGFGGEPPTHLLAAQVLGAHIAAQANGSSGPIAWSPPDGSGASAPTLRDDGAAPGQNLGLDALPDFPRPQSGALTASAAAAPAAARITTEETQPTAGPFPSSGSSPALAGGIYRPEFPNGRDPLPSLLERSDPGHTPPGFFVDPKTGAVSRPKFIPSGDPLNPTKVVLAPATSQDMQDYFERRTGARANYQPGLMSPEEQFKRAQLEPGAPSQPNEPPISANASGGRVIYTNPDGSTFAEGGWHPNRDRNPMNIRSGPLARGHGALGDDSGFAIFPSGRVAFGAAMDRMNDIAANHSSSHGQPPGSLANLVYVWSPPEDHNHTEEMIHDITKATGFDRNAKWESLTLEQRKAFLRAYGRREGYSGKEIP